MTIGYRWIVTLGGVLAIVLGIGLGTKFSQWARSMDEATVSADERPAADDVPPVPEAPPPAATVPRPTTPKQLRLVSPLPRVSPDAPELLGRLQPLLNKGADMAIAAEGFRDAETFAAVAHAARNTEVPFMVLKHQVVNKRKPLDKAIAELKPTVNAPIEANRARAEARSDIASLAS
jgi:hypothetical protein